MESQEIYQKLLDHFGKDVILEHTEVDDKAGIRDPFITVRADKIDKVCLYCRVDDELDLDFCQSITGLDTGDTITCVYHLFSYSHHGTTVLKVAVPRDNPRLPTTTVAWPASDWYERETAEMYGVVFEGHPDPRNLLLPEDWEGFPMRKDYVEKPYYNGIPTTRENTLDLLDEDA